MIVWLGNNAKKLMVVMLSIMICFVTTGYAGGKIPENIRIGLYFTRTAVSSVEISSQNGFKFGYERDGAFIAIWEEPSLQRVTVRKDSYYAVTPEGMIEYSPNAPTIPAGKKYGPYHVQIGQDYDNYDDARQQLENLKQKGLSVYPAFYDGFYKIWTGAYTSTQEAEKALGAIKETSSQDARVIIPGAVRIQVVNSHNNQIIFMFDSTSWHLMMYPIAGKEGIPVIDVNGKLYRGAVEFKRFSDSDMTVINYVDFEEYLYGVLPREMGANWPMEALKTQAVAARTFAMLHMNRYSDYGFNLCTTTTCQVYGGYSVERNTCTNAVEQTRGQVLTYQGAPAQVYYFATSGGHTADVRNVWGGTGLPYLQGVEDPYEDIEVAMRGIWEVSFIPAQIHQILQDRDIDVGQITSMYVSSYSKEGRAVELTIEGTHGQHTFERSNTRNIFGVNVVNSQKYVIQTDSDIHMMGQDTDSISHALVSQLQVLSASGTQTLNTTNNRIYAMGANTKKSYSVIPSIYHFNGRGWGHGVGLSQWGARGMADEGFTHDQILPHYFPGTEIQQWGEVDN